MGDRVWSIPRDQFVAVWNAAATLDEATAKVREVVGGAAPRWALLARAGTIRKEGVELKAFAPPQQNPRRANHDTLSCTARSKRKESRDYAPTARHVVTIAPHEASLYRLGRCGKGANELSEIPPERVASKTGPGRSSFRCD